MNTTIDLFLGDAISVTSEQAFLARLVEDLTARGEPALILANFFPQRNPLQVDFLIATAQRAIHVELKNYGAPLFGERNGPWHLQLPDGSTKLLDNRNPYRQALEQKYAISDDMALAASGISALPKAPPGGKYYSIFESVVCVYPQLSPGSRCASDFRVRVIGYADLLKRLHEKTSNPCPWNLDHWLEYALYLGLRRDDSPVTRGEISPGSNAARQLDAYRARFAAFYANSLPTLVPTRTLSEGREGTSANLLDFLSLRKHGTLLGVSGSGKTHLSKHIALTANRAGTNVLFVSAREYGGKLSSLLDRNVAHLHPGTAIELLNSSVTAGQPVALVVDEVDKCPVEHKEHFFRDLQAVFLRYQTPVIFTCQKNIELPQAFRGDIYELVPLSGDEKPVVLSAHTKSPCTPVQLGLLEPFSTPYELSIAAQCIEELPEITTRADLLDSFIRKRCETSKQPAAVRQLACGLAAKMTEAFSAELVVGDLWHLAEPILESEEVPHSTVYDLLGSGLVDVRQGRCRFRHEQLQCFLAAENLVHTARQQLPDALAKPIYADTSAFALASLRDPHLVLACLKAAGKPSLLVECLRGALGPMAQGIALKECHQALAAATEMLAHIDVDLHPEDTTWEGLHLVGMPVADDRAALTAIGMAISQNDLLELTADLIARTEALCREQLRAKGRCNENGRLQNESGLFSSLYVFGAQQKNRLPVTVILEALHNTFRTAAGVEVPRITSLMDRYPSTVGVLYLVCLLAQKIDDRFAIVISHLLKRSWATGIYHLRLEALQAAQFYRGVPDQSVRKAIAETLSSLETKNILLSSALVDAMMSYDLIDPITSSQEAIDQVQAILMSGEDEDNCRRAYGAITNIFEDIHGSAYYDAYRSLDLPDRTKLLALAAHGIPGWGMSRDWIVRELQATKNPESLPALLKWATHLPKKCVSRQETTAAYFTAVSGCALFLEQPPRLDPIDSQNAKAWQLVGEVVFWRSKGDECTELTRQRCEPLWRELEACLSLETVDVLLHLKHAGAMYASREEGHLRRLLTDFPGPIRRILERGIVAYDRLTSIFGAITLFDGVLPSIISLLGHVGDAQSVTILTQFAESKSVGEGAVRAIRSIQSRGR